jgi:hypothetical protein
MTGVVELLELPSLLSWDRPSPLADSLECVRLEEVSARLSHEIERMARADARAAADLKERLDRLGDAAVDRILAAPEAFYRLAGEDEARGAAFLRDAVEAEELRSGLRDHSDRDIWSCLGDRWFPSGPIQTPRESLHWSPDTPYAAPAVAPDLPLDWASPYARGRLPELSGTDTDLSLSEREAVLAKVREAFRVLASASPVADATVRRFARVVVVRRDVEDGILFTSASSRFQIGRPVLRNAHRDDVGPADVLDGIVHETIHSMLDLVESRSNFVPDCALRGERLQSPWTGRSLDIDTYVHACFVWTGLFQLWLAATVTGAVDGRTALRFLRLASHGFTSADVVSALAPLRNGLEPDLIVALSDAQRRVRAGVGLLLDAHAAVAS